MVTFNKREFLGAPLLAALGLGIASRASGQPADGAPAPIANLAPGRFAPTVQSLKQYQTPEWFRDAKFGIWAHWGPQAVPRQGDWYARFMYVPGHPHYEHHLKTWGHPSEHGYKDVIPLWKAEQFDPEALVASAHAVGAEPVSRRVEEHR